MFWITRFISAVFLLAQKPAAGGIIMEIGITLEGRVVKVMAAQESPHNFGCTIEPDSLVLSEEVKKAYQTLTIGDDYFKAIPVTICNDDGPVKIKVGDHVRVYSKPTIDPDGLKLDSIEVLDQENGIRTKYRCH